MQRNLSVETIEALNKIVRTCRHLRHAIGREPTPEEVASRLRMPPEAIRKALGPPCTLTRH
jgi:RNA polymerase primary sigma factor